MKELRDYKLGDVAEKELLGDLLEFGEGEMRLLKITYTFQDKEATTIDLSAIHKDFQDEEQEKQKGENRK